MSVDKLMTTLLGEHYVDLCTVTVMCFTFDRLFA